MRRPEISQAVFARVLSIGEVDGRRDAEYLDGLRRATDAAIDLTLDSIDRPDDLPLRVPLPLIGQARLAARRQLQLETMLRRYLAGHAVLIDFVAQEAARQDVSPALMGPILRSLAARTDLTVATISAAYVDEQAGERPSSPDRRRAEAVRRLLGGELIETGGIDYDFARWHLALVFRGPDSREAVGTLTSPIDARRLIVSGEEGSFWVWLGSRGRLEPAAIEERIRGGLPSRVRIGIGEPAEGRAGWRLAHEQAKAALAVAVRRPEISARYADVALLASAMQDDLTATSLRQLYLAPLDESDRGGVLRETVRAYLATRGNVTSAAAALDVDRRTVTNRLRLVEERLGSSLNERMSELTIALQLDRLDPPSPT